MCGAQPLAPCALSLEGTVLGASQITWVGGRTVLSAIVALSFFSLVSSQGWALPGIWAGGVLGCHTLAACLMRYHFPNCHSHLFLCRMASCTEACLSLYMLRCACLLLAVVHMSVRSCV